MYVYSLLDGFVYFWSLIASIFDFFDVDPALIKKTSELVFIEEFSTATLECYVDANPIPKKVIKWIRRKNDSESTVPLSSSFDEDESAYHTARIRYETEVFEEDSPAYADGIKVKSSLVISNATLQDSGTSFDCIADNGVGKESKSTMTLLVLRK